MSKKDIESLKEDIRHYIVQMCKILQYTEEVEKMTLDAFDNISDTELYNTCAESINNGESMFPGIGQLSKEDKEKQLKELKSIFDVEEIVWN